MNGTETIRWLFDLEVGGKPAAFLCLLYEHPFHKVTPGTFMSKGGCGKVTRTLSGMKAHQKAVHGFKAQGALFGGKAEESYAGSSK